MSNETASEIDSDAAGWAVRRETRESDPAFAAELEAWLAGDPRRPGALLRAEATLSYLNRGRALGAGAVASRPLPRVTRRHLVMAGSGLAAFAAGLGGVAFFVSRGQSYRTSLGEVRQVPLADGSVTAINTDTEIRVAMTSRERRLVLAKGEVWLNVAKDPQRPFVVEAGDVRVRALGTAFSVRWRDGGAEVLVTAGAVETWSVGDEAHRLRLGAGSKALVTRGQPLRAEPAAAEMTHALAWRDGQISLYGETLAAAAAEFNRYNARKIVIADPDLAGEKVVGQFSAYDPEAFARATANTLGARFVADGTVLRLYRGPKP